MKIVIQGDFITKEKFKSYLKERYNYEQHKPNKAIFLVLYKNFLPMMISNDGWTVKQKNNIRVVFALISLQTIKELSTKNYDIWITKNLYSLTTLITIIITKLRRKKNAIVVKEWFTRKKSIPGYVNHILFKYFTKYLIGSYLAYSTKSQKFLIREYNISSKKIYLVPKASELSQLEKKQKLKLNSKHNILIIARGVEFKGLDIFLQALKPFNKKFKTTIVGDMSGKYGEYCKKLAKGLDVTFTGKIGNKKGSKEVDKYLNQADLFILPNKFTPKNYEIAEIWGSVVDEALYFKLPVIVTTATGCADDLIKNKGTGIVIKENSIREIQRVLQDYLDNPKKWKAMKNNSLKTLEERDEKNYQGHKQFFENIANNKI